MVVLRGSANHSFNQIQAAMQPPRYNLKSEFEHHRY